MGCRGRGLAAPTEGNGTKNTGYPALTGDSPFRCRGSGPRFRVRVSAAPTEPSDETTSFATLTGVKQPKNKWVPDPSGGFSWGSGSGSRVRVLAAPTEPSDAVTDEIRSFATSTGVMELKTMGTRPLRGVLLSGVGVRVPGLGFGFWQHQRILAGLRAEGFWQG